MDGVLCSLRRRIQFGRGFRSCDSIMQRRRVRPVHVALGEEGCLIRSICSASPFCLDLLFILTIVPKHQFYPLDESMRGIPTRNRIKKTKHGIILVFTSCKFLLSWLDTYLMSSLGTELYWARSRLNISSSTAETCLSNPGVGVKLHALTQSVSPWDTTTQFRPVLWTRKR